MSNSDSFSPRDSFSDRGPTPIGRLANLLSLSRYDRPYKESLTSSVFAAPIFVNFPAACRAQLSASNLTLNGQLGHYLQWASFGLFTLLFALLGLPQFASDKEGLALVSLTSLIFFILGRLLGGKGGREVRAVDTLVLGYFGANIVAAFASHYLPESLKGLSKVAVYILSYFLFTASLQGSRKRMVAVMIAALFTGLLVSLYGLYQYKIGVAPLATWEDPSVESKGTRIYSTLGNPNLLAGYLIPLTPIAISLVMAALTIKSWLKWPSVLAAFGCASIIGLATVLTGSRGGYLSLGAMGAVFALVFISHLFIQRPKLVLPSFICIIILLALSALAVHSLAPHLEQRLLSIFAGSEHSSNAYRLHVYRASIKMFKDNWWFGVGPGNTAFRLAYGLYMKSGFDALGTYCVPLEVGVECGVLGLLFFLGLLTNAMAAGHITFWRRPGDKLEAYLALGLTAALVGLIVQGMVDTVFYRPQVHFLFWLVVSALVELRAGKTTASPDPVI